MTRRATVSAPANIALVKYWGARDIARVVPFNPSISMTLEVCRSTTTVEPIPLPVSATAERPNVPGEGDEIWLVEDGARIPAPAAFATRIEGHLEVLRRRTGTGEHFRVATSNSFPAAAGLASSASGFAALACAVVRALEIPEETVDDLSVLARLSGSGSAARSVLGGYVEWPGDGMPEGSAGDGPARQLAPAGHWDLRDVIALVQDGAKEVSSLEGHRRAPGSPHFTRRLECLPERLAGIRRAIAERDAETLGRLLEQDAIDLHAIAMTSEPPIFYWRPATLAVLEEVRALRRTGHAAWYTMDAGANVHVLCGPRDEDAVAERLASIAGVHGVIRDRAGDGPRDETIDLLALPEAAGESAHSAEGTR